MKQTYVIALDTHCTFTEIGVMTMGGKMIRRDRCRTTIPALIEKIEDIRGAKKIVLEEGPLADWLKRGLLDHVESVTICDPRRNHLIAKDSEKDDPIDVEKLADLFRGGYIKEVHHPECFDRIVFKRFVSAYHDAVKERVRAANRLMAELRHYGLFENESALRQVDTPDKFVSQLPDQPLVHECFCVLWHRHYAMLEQEQMLRSGLITYGRNQPMIVRFSEIPGVKWIRASTFFAYVDTPWRFRTKQALWKYLGIGLERRHSGDGPVRLRTPRQVNRRLKSTILGAAKSAIASRNSPFADQYERWVHGGISPRNARRNVARSLATVMWGMWKTDSVYRPDWVGVVADQVSVA